MKVITATLYGSSGRFLQTITDILPGVQAEAESKGIFYMEGAHNGETHYVVDGKKIPRPEMNPAFDKAQIAADGAELITLSGLPDPCTLTLTDPEGKVQNGEVAGGSTQFNTDLAGLHTVKVDAWPHLSWEGSFNGVV